MITLSLLVNILLASQINHTPQVMVTIKPIHALVSGVMTDIGKPELLLAGGESPHTYNMKPSQVRQLHQVDLLIWVGSNVETFLQKTLTSLEEKKQFRLDKVSGLHLLKTRKGGRWLAHHHHSSHNDMQTREIDPHIWLDPNNAKVIVNAVAYTLSQMDAQNATHYEQNALRLIQRIEELDQRLTRQLTPLKAMPFLVFHDAYQYFEYHYGLTAVGTVTLASEQLPGAKRLHELRTQIQTQGVKCVFSEPQFTSHLITTLLEDTSAYHGELDPIGSTLKAGTEAYFMLLQNLADNFELCLLPKD